MELKEIKGIGPKTEELLNKLNIYTINDLIEYFPYRYNVYTPTNILDEDNTIVITGRIVSDIKCAFIRRNFNRLSFKFETNNLIINVSIFNRMYLKQQLYINKEVTLIGKYDKLKNNFNANNIKLYPLYSTEVESVYHLISGIKKATLIKAIKNALDNYEFSHINKIPEYLQNNYNFVSEEKAIKEIHFPTSSSNLKQAKLKLKYDELFEFMFKINIIKYRNSLLDNFIIKQVNEEDLNYIIKSIPFELTYDQLSAINDIYQDFNDFKRMNRLILGDVGSGKTIVSFVALLLNYKCGYQGAMLAPTEVLARQHYDNFKNIFKNTKINIALLTGSTSVKEKKQIIEDLKNNKIDILIGTHAILEDNVEFNNLGLVVTDEQHRFGVNQRKILQNKGSYVDVLYASATPIPRTYALTIYGDMDISQIKTKPKGRKEIITKLFKENDKTYLDNIRKELELNHQIYVIAPLIEEDEESNLNDINKIKEDLENTFNDYKIDILHGKMNNKKKDEIMSSFKNKEIDILISTTVIEVGVDVENATMMIIYNAERFGLATLHQLRGRVGRNDVQSYCYLISDYESERLKVLCESNDGFYISEKDFELRGSGDLFGIKQSGDMVFKVANIHTDYKILLQCKKDCEEFIKNNIENNFREYKYYNQIVENLMEFD